MCNKCNNTHLKLCPNHPLYNLDKEEMKFLLAFV